MLSRKYIEKIRKMDEQYGPPEQSFSPDWHAQNPYVPRGAVFDGKKETEEGIRIVLGYRKTPGGGITIAQYESEEERDADPDGVK